MNFAGTLSHWKNKIIHSFTVIGESTINNGRIKNINQTMKTIKRNTNGYNVEQHFIRQYILQIKGLSRKVCK